MTEHRTRDVLVLRDSLRTDEQVDSGFGLGAGASPWL